MEAESESNGAAAEQAFLDFFVKQMALMSGPTAMQAFEEAAKNGSGQAFLDSMLKNRLSKIDKELLINIDNGKLETKTEGKEK